MTVIQCPYCSHSGPENDSWAIFFCPSEPDKCNGCELDPEYSKCPECDEEFLTIDARYDTIEKS